MYSQHPKKAGIWNHHLLISLSLQISWGCANTGISSLVRFWWMVSLSHTVQFNLEKSFRYSSAPWNEARGYWQSEGESHWEYLPWLQSAVCLPRHTSTRNHPKDVILLPTRYKTIIYFNQYTFIECLLCARQSAKGSRFRVHILERIDSSRS